MAELDLADIILWDDYAETKRFEGLSNTQELRETVIEMFHGARSMIEIMHVQGTTKRFKCTLRSNAATEDEVADIISTFEKNSYITTRNSKRL